jgi:TolA-binding protein
MLLASEQPWSGVPLVDAKVQQLMQDRDYPAAIAAIDEAIGAEGAPHDYLSYLKGRALYLDKQYDAAVEVFRQLEKQFPDSQWLRRARLAAAVALARKGDFRAAELIYRAEAEYLLSPDRKQQIAGIYVEFADAYFKPTEKDQEPDYKKALAFYEKAIEVGPKAEKQIELELLVAQCHQELGNYEKAAELYAKFIQDHADDAQDVEARFRLGECHLAEENLREARRTWQDLLAEYPKSASPRVADSMFHLARTWRIPEPANDEELSLGTAALEAFLKRFADHELATQAHLDIAKSYMHRQRHEEAVASLTRFLEDKRYRDREEIADGLNLLGQSYLSQAKLDEALSTWRKLLADYPTHEQWSAVQQAVIDTEYLKGRENFRSKRYEEARQVWSEFLAKYPLDQRNPEILFQFGEMNHAQKEWDAAIADWRRLVSKHADSEKAAEARLRIAATLEEELDKLEEALDEYREVPWGPHHAAAQQAISRLTSKSLVAAVDRVFRSNEAPRLELATRNIESLTFRVYDIDLETYFRKMHLADEIADLDIALIDPDSSFEFQVPEYERYRQSENSVEIPMPRDAPSGVAAVTVSSKTLEATALVIRSDLDIIVKSSRDEVFVLAENMRTGKPWPGARLLISNGAKVFAEGVTGDDGVFRRTDRELMDAQDVRVFAVKDGHVASNMAGLQGLGVAQGLSDKGYIYTDRPVYRAGQRVCVRGCIRQASDDAYTIEEGKKYALEVLDHRNRLIWQQDVTLGHFGSFQTRFGLPPTSPQGEYRVLVTDETDRSYQGTFRVLEYKLEPVRLTVEAPQTVYYRGDVIEGTIRAEFYYGAPLTGRSVRYQLADNRVHTATTDQNGEIRFSLPTREFSESQLLPMVVTLPERNLEIKHNFFLATQGFGIDVSSVRSVYVAGETLEVTVKTYDAASDPVGRDLVLKVIEQTVVDGKVGERQVQEHPLTTAADSGIAHQTLLLEKGGRYVLRAEGTDRFGNPVWGTLPLGISDVDDEVRLRILADRHTYKVGDQAAVKLHWRENPALALVTFQGARVLDYQLVQLKQGMNELSIPLTAQLAPNFELAVAVMTDGAKGEGGGKKGEGGRRKAETYTRFHEASSPFTVERELNVTITSKAKGKAEGPVRPGEELEVTVTTTDPQGNPVAAEVSLAMVEQSLLDRFAWPVEPISQFFQGVPRESAVRTASSITFAHYPQTRPINPWLLTEQERIEIAREEEASLQHGMVGGFFGGFGGAAGFERKAITKPRMPVEGDPFGGESIDQSVHERIVDRLGSRPFVTSAVPVPSQADFDTLTELIKSTIEPTKWESVGGPGVIASFPANLELVVSQTQEVHDGPAAAETPRLLPVDPAPGETAYWNPKIVTGEDGRATITLTVPGRSTAWGLVAKGITTDTLAGEATDTVVAKKDLFGELKLPMAFTDGDAADVAVLVHNDALEAGQIDLVLKTTIGGRSVEEKKTIDVDAKGIHELAFRTQFQLPQDRKEKETAQTASETYAVFELTVVAGERRDIVRRAIPLLPYGMPVFATVGGSATSDNTVWVEASKEMPLSAPHLRIMIGPTVEQSLVNIVLAPAPWCQVEMGRLASSAESTTSDLMASLGLQKLLAGTRDAGGPQAAALDSRIRSSVPALIASQNDDGGWSWTGHEGASNRYGTARCVWALSLARSAGYVVQDDSFKKALAYLGKQLTLIANTDYEGKAILLHALSVAGRGDFALANRLYRERPSLSAAALVHLALALAEMERRETAGELLELLTKKDLDYVLSRRESTQGVLPWSRSPADLRALQALALVKVKSQAPETKESVDWLLAHRTGHRWAPDKATGPAALALCQWFTGSRFEDEKYKLSVFVNDIQIKVLNMDSASGTQEINVPAKHLQEGKQRVNFQITGRGRYTYQCILSGFVPADQLKSTTTDWQIKRTYRPAPLEVDGREIPRGFEVVQGDFSRFTNPLTQLPTGRRCLVELDFRRQVSKNTSEDHLDYLAVTEPIPSGTAIIEPWVNGPFERFEISRGAITFYIGNRRSSGTIRYQLSGYLPGEYRAGPTVMRNAHRPDQMAVAAPKPLVVLAEGAKSSDPYRLTPQELYELGKYHYGQGDWKATDEHLAKLTGNWGLRAEIYRDVVHMLLNVHLELASPANVVRYFEIIKERWPDQEIPFEKGLKIAAAYHEMGEYERSYLGFRAIVEGNFMRESSVAGFLESQGEFTRTVDVMQRMLREYPPEPYVASATYGLAQRVSAKAPEAAEDAALREQEINRVDLIRHASDMLESFLTAYPEDPAADQAAFAKANALLELGAYDKTAAACARYAERYPKSSLLDTYWYIIGYCHFAAGRHQAAIEMCRKVAEAKLVDAATGRPRESTNKWQAVYILGQVYHSLGRAAEAVRQYQRVEDRFADAKRSIEYFLRKSIDLAEVTTVRPGRPVEAELRFRNMATCDVKVYRIDLMKFGLLRRNLGGIARINLAGIRPQHEATVELGNGLDYRDRTQKLPLPLEQEGAYLVVCRGDNLHTSGLVLITPLALEVQHDPTAAQVRATVKDVVADRYLRDVHVKVMGSSNADFISGSTDLRGVFVAEGIKGSPTVIAQDDADRYAFFRGTAAQPARARGAQATMPSQAVVEPVDKYQPLGFGRQRVTANERRINAALDSPTDVQFFETPLQDVVDYLRLFHEIPIELDKRALEDVGIATDVPITRSLQGITLRSALRLLLRDLDLTYTVEDEVLQITTPEEAEIRLSTVVYPVTDLVRFRDESGNPWSDFDQLKNTLISTVEPVSWEDVGGPGSVYGMTYGDTDVLVLSQTQDVHREIADVLATLRRVAGTKEEKDGELPYKERPQYDPNDPFGGYGGMGGGFGGMGGMGVSGAPAAPGMGAGFGGFQTGPGNQDLLKGLQDANKQFQGKQMEKLQRMYDQGRGMGGMGAGGFH